MYKITQQTNEAGKLIPRYTLKAYYYNPLEKRNKELYSAINLDKATLALYLQGRTTAAPDTDFAFVVLKSTGRPVILTDAGEIAITPVVA